MTLRRILPLTGVLAALIVTLGLLPRQEGLFEIDSLATPILADGRTPILLHANSTGKRLRFETFKASIIEGQNRASIERAAVHNGKVELTLRPGVLPGRVMLQLTADGFASSRAEFTTLPLTSDAIGDVTPDFLRLGPGDDDAFRTWFTYLAESQYYRPHSRIAKEINDCAALIRFAYRETLRDHDSKWANDLDIDDPVSFPAVAKYR